jgi:hypothetical protein
MWTTSVIKKKLPNVSNNPIGDNSPNLVTLVPVKMCWFQFEKKTEKRLINELAGHGNAVNRSSGNTFNNNSSGNNTALNNKPFAYF